MNEKLDRSHSFNMSYVTSSVPKLVDFCSNPPTQVKQLHIKSMAKVTIVYNLREFARSLNTRPSILLDWINEFVTFEAAEQPVERRGRHASRLEAADYFNRITAYTLSCAIESAIRKFILCPKCQGLIASCGCTLDAPQQKHTNCRCDACDLMTLGTRASCCWCIDTRSNEEINDIEIRLDAHGFVKPSQYYIYWPIDAAYCSTCRTCAPTAELYANLSSAVTAFNGVRD